MSNSEVKWSMSLGNSVGYIVLVSPESQTNHIVTELLVVLTWLDSYSAESWTLNRSVSEEPVVDEWLRQAGHVNNKKKEKSNSFLPRC